MNPTERFLDKAGREVFPGDYIVYGHALGRCAGLQYGRVLDVIPAVRDDKYAKYTGICAKIRVRGVDAHDNWLGYTKQDKGYKAGKVELLKPGVLCYPSRVLKVEPHQIPEAILGMLEQIEVP